MCVFAYSSMCKTLYPSPAAPELTFAGNFAKIHLTSKDNRENLSHTCISVQALTHEIPSKFLTVVIVKQQITPMMNADACWGVVAGRFRTLPPLALVVKRGVKPCNENEIIRRMRSCSKVTYTYCQYGWQIYLCVLSAFPRGDPL